jgi:hypothetical protein
MLMLQCALTRGTQAFGDAVIEFFRASIEHATNLSGKLFFAISRTIHGLIPFAASAAARVWVAREQWVLTLPSVQPMAAAVSAISNPSQ